MITKRPSSPKARSWPPSHSFSTRSSRHSSEVVLRSSRANSWATITWWCGKAKLFKHFYFYSSIWYRLHIMDQMGSSDLDGHRLIGFFLISPPFQVFSLDDAFHFAHSLRVRLRTSSLASGGRKWHSRNENDFKVSRVLLRGSSGFKWTAFTSPVSFVTTVVLFHRLMPFVHLQRCGSQGVFDVQDTGGQNGRPGHGTGLRVAARQRGSVRTYRLDRRHTAQSISSFFQR